MMLRTSVIAFLNTVVIYFVSSKGEALNFAAMLSEIKLLIIIYFFTELNT